MQYDKNDIVFFTVPKPFQGITGTIQRNAIRSWTTLGFEVFLCGREPETKEVAGEFGVGYIDDIECSEFGTPLLSSVFRKVAENSDKKVLCYSNADMIFLSDFTRALRGIRLKQFVMTGFRHNVDLREPVDFGHPDWEARLKAYAVARGVFYVKRGLDYFVFTRNRKLMELPPFIVGRPPWDNWFIYHARIHDIPVIDSTKYITAIHQMHDFNHVPQREKGTDWEGPEAAHNRRLCRDGMLLKLEDDASHELSEEGRMERITDKKRQSKSLRYLGYSFRKKNRAKALLYYVRSLWCHYDAETVRAVFKLFTPGYYRKKEW